MNTRETLIDTIYDILDNGLSAYTCPIYKDDNNDDREFPCVIIGIDALDRTANMLAHYEADLNITLKTNGNDDSGNSLQRGLGDTINDVLCELGIDELSSDGLKAKGYRFKGMDYNNDGDINTVEYKAKVWLYQTR